MNPILPSRTSRREAGSAYIIALMVLVVLTILGLGLALITQTELQIGANERTMQRLFYASDSGISRATAQTVYSFNCAPIGDPLSGSTGFDLTDTGEILTQTASQIALAARQHVEVSPVLPVMDPPCPLCNINNAGGSQAYGEQTYFDVNHAVTSTSTRLSDLTVPPREYGRRTVSTFISIQPWPKMPDCYGYYNSPEAAEIKL